MERIRTFIDPLYLDTGLVPFSPARISCRDFVESRPVVLYPLSAYCIPSIRRYEKCDNGIHGFSAHCLTFNRPIGPGRCLAISVTSPATVFLGEPGHQFCSSVVTMTCYSIAPHESLLCFPQPRAVSPTGWRDRAAFIGEFFGFSSYPSHHISLSTEGDACYCPPLTCRSHLG